MMCSTSRYFLLHFMLVNIIFSSFLLRKKLPYVVTRDVCPSSVEITLERGSDRSAEPIDLKIGLNMGN